MLGEELLEARPDLTPCVSATSAAIEPFAGSDVRANQLRDDEIGCQRADCDVTREGTRAGRASDVSPLSIMRG